MKKIFATKTVVSLFNVLNNLNYEKLDDESKIALWKTVRSLKPIATKYQEDSSSAIEKLRPSDEEFQKNLNRFVEYENKLKRGESTEGVMTKEEYDKFFHDKLKPVNDLIEKALKEFADKEVEVEITPLSSESFDLLVVSNNMKFDLAFYVWEHLFGESE